MFKPKALSRICDLPINAFGQYGDRVVTPDGLYFYKNRGAKILAVAHLDTVQHPSPLRQKGDVVWHPCLDDRLGAYLLLEVLPQLGVEFDLLLTEGEEVGRSTAAYFPRQKQYNWMFSFDRAGMDVVLYQYQDQLLERLVEYNDMHVGLGSFSDIAFLEHLGCKGLNFGVGYYDNHSPNAYANLSHTAWMVSRFMEFYRDCKDTEMPHEPQTYQTEAEKRLDRLCQDWYA
jgi:hypothetical protein